MTSKSTISTRDIAKIALLTSLVFCGTYLIKIPTPTGGYVHPGDAFVLLSAFVLNPWAAALASGLGAALADLSGGYLAYLPATFIIKAIGALCMAYFAPKIKEQMDNNLPKFFVYFPTAVLANALMLFGYFIYEIFLYDFSVAVLGIPGNLAQGLCALILAYLLLFPLKPLFRK